jgi:ribosomal protein S18 acetylase RimI-like enzyme
MLVVDDAFKHQGVGSYAISYSEDCAKNNGKTAIRVYTTRDNEAATKCYLKNGYEIIKEIRYSVGDGVIRDGYEFRKSLI